MATSSSLQSPESYSRGPTANRQDQLATRVASAYLVAGVLWIVISDLTVSMFGGFDGAALLVSIAKGLVFVALSSALVFWLCRREYRQIRQVTDLLKAVIDVTTDAVIVKDTSGRYLFANSAASGFIGRSATELLGRHDRDLFAGPEVERMLEGDQRIMSGKSVVELEETLTSHGVTRTYHSTKAPYRDRTGKVNGLIGFCRDITEQKQIEAVLQETDARLREAQRIARLGSWSWEPETNRVWWSDAEFELFGVSPHSVEPSLDSFLGFLHPDDRAVARQRVEVMKSGANAFADDLRVLRNDGSIMWIHSRAQATRDASGKLLRVEGTDQDITAQRLAQAELRESEQRYRLLFESNPQPMWVYDVNTLRFLAVNDAAVMAYGYTREEFLGMTIHDIRPSEEIPRLDVHLAEKLPGLHPGAPWLHRRKDGTVFDVEVSSHDLPMGKRSSRLVLALDVTDRKRAESELQASEQRLRLALEAAGAIAFVWDIPNDLVTRYYSIEPALPVTGNEASRLNDVRARVHPDDLSAFDSRLKGFLEAGSEYRNEYRVIRDDGSIASLEEFGFLDRADDGSALRLTGLSLDVSKRVAATEALRTSESRYRQLVDLLPTAIFVHADNKILFANAAFVRLMGLEDEAAVIHRNVLDFVHPSSQAAMLERQAEMKQTRVPMTGCDMLCVRSDGRAVPAHVVAAPIDGYGTFATLVALSDLTERERAAAILRSVLDSVDDAILTMNAHGTVSSANRATERLFGYSANELVGGDLSILMPKQDYLHRERFIDNYLHTLVPHVPGVGREVEARRKDGSTFPAELTITEFIRDGEQEFTAVLRDVAARRQLEEQFRQAQKMEAVGRLAGGVAHDFNNLLTVINGYSELVLAELGADDPARGPLTAIHDAGDRAARLTEQLLAFSRKSIVQPSLVDLNELVIESAKLLRRLIGEDIALSVTTQPSPVLVLIDPGQFEQVLMNLAVNARDAMPTGGKLSLEISMLEVETSADRAHPELSPGQYASVRVVDTGCGMTPEVREKIFEPFFTTKGIGKGTGLGLAVVHGIIEQAGGSVTVESNVGEGSAFQILLPSVADSIRDATVRESLTAPRGHETVLVVEDEDAVRMLVRVVLEGQGYSVLSATDGDSARQLLQSLPSDVDLLVTDVIMPTLSGYELARELRAERPHLKVLFMSGYTDDALDRHGLQSEGDQFLQKPFTPLGLARRVREILDQ